MVIRGTRAELLENGLIILWILLNLLAVLICVEPVSSRIFNHLCSLNPVILLTYTNPPIVVT